MFRISSVAESDESYTHTVCLVGPGTVCHALVHVEWPRSRSGSYDLRFCVLSVQAPPAIRYELERWLDEHQDEVADATNDGYVERPCDRCDVLTRADVLGDASELGPFPDEEWCPTCVAVVDADGHSDDCGCSSCDVARDERARRELGREAAVCGGLSDGGLGLLGWKDE